MMDEAAMSAMQLARVELAEKAMLEPVLRLAEQAGFSAGRVRDCAGQPAQPPQVYLSGSGSLPTFLGRSAECGRLRLLDYEPAWPEPEAALIGASVQRTARALGFDAAQQRRYQIHSNVMIRFLEENGIAPAQTVAYLDAFSGTLARTCGAGYEPRVTHLRSHGGIAMVLVEPPCGSNALVLQLEDRLLFVDSGYARFQKELWQVLEREIPNFAVQRKEMLLTHTDVDHAGCTAHFDRIYLSQNSYDDFVAERTGELTFRDDNPLHGSYIQGCKLLSGYTPSQRDNLQVIGGKSGLLTQPLEYIGPFEIGPLQFEAYEGAGGHVRGETVYLERRQQLAFTGDILVNLKGMIPAQAQFNTVAPKLMFSVDMAPQLARAERAAVTALLADASWQVFGGHGAPFHMAPKETI